MLDATCRWTGCHLMRGAGGAATGVASHGHRAVIVGGVTTLTADTLLPMADIFEFDCRRECWVQVRAASLLEGSQACMMHTPDQLPAEEEHPIGRAFLKKKWIAAA